MSRYEWPKEVKDSDLGEILIPKNMKVGSPKIFKKSRFRNNKKHEAPYFRAIGRLAVKRRI